MRASFDPLREFAARGTHFLLSMLFFSHFVGQGFYRVVQLQSLTANRFSERDENNR